MDLNDIQLNERSSGEHEQPRQRQTLDIQGFHDVSPDKTLLTTKDTIVTPVKPVSLDLGSPRADTLGPKFSTGTKITSSTRAPDGSDLSNSSRGSGLSTQKGLDEQSESKLSMFNAISLNTMNMFGTGPLITIPYCVTAVSPMGPHAVYGYIFACLACVCDSCVWGELGSMWPETGGSYIYLRRLYGFDTWGRFAAFIYIWQFFISGPAEIASAFIAIAEYLVYFSPQTVSYGWRVSISLTGLSICTWLLYRNNKEVGSITTILWVITVLAMIFSIVGGFANYESENMRARPEDSPVFTSFMRSMTAMAAATKFAIYDMTGYYDVCFMGGEVANARRTIPVSCVSTCIVVGILNIVIYIAVLGALNWQTYGPMYNPEAFGVKDDGSPPVGVMSLFTEHITGGSVVAAAIVTIVVATTIFGSVFSMMLGMGYLPYAAAQDGLFFSFLGHRHSRYEGLADYSLLMVSGLAGIFCFVDLDLVIDVLTTMIVLVQFLGQSIGLLWYRYRVPLEQQADYRTKNWRMPLFPIPCICQIIMFSGIFFSTKSYFLYGSAKPVQEICLGFLLLGAIAFMVFSKSKSNWPFEGDIDDRPAFTRIKSMMSPDRSPDMSPVAVVDHSGRKEPSSYSSGQKYTMESIKGDNQETDLPPANSHSDLLALAATENQNTKNSGSGTNSTGSENVSADSENRESEASTPKSQKDE